MMRSGNPALRADTFTKEVGYATGDSGVMTIQGTVNKTMGLLLLLVVCASFVWRNPAPVVPFLLPLMFVGLVVAFITVFKKQSAAITAPVYAGIEGIILGVVSAMFEAQYPGIVMQAIMLTFGTLFCLLLAYKSRLIKPTENFKLGIFAATGAIAVLYMVSIIMGFFGASIPMIHSSGPIGIGFSLVVVVIAALNLVLDFDFIEAGADAGAPKYMEWYGAFGLLVTLVWLYLEILRLLAKLNSRR